jgi:superfamily II DNA/RNA helicase
MNAANEVGEAGFVTGFSATLSGMDEETRVFPQHITVHFEKDPGEKLDFIRSTLEEYGFDAQTERALVFVHRRRDAEDFADGFGEAADYYHAGRDSSEKEEVAARFECGEVAILFATKAFGMGVDIRNIRYVFHTMPPSSVEDYVQEIGRAGRDGLPSHAFLPFDDEDFNDVRSRLVKTQLHWSMVVDMQQLLLKYRHTLVGAERDSFVVPEDLIATEPSLSQNLFGQGAAATRQRMLLHSLEEAGRVEVSGFEMTHWPVELGERAGDESARKIRDLAAARGATTVTKTLIAERDLRQVLGLDSDAAAREQLFQASKIGAVRIPFDVAIDWTKWAKDEKNSPYIDGILNGAQSFLRKIRNMEGDRLVIAHEVIHPAYLSNKEKKREGHATRPAETRFDERKPSLVRFLRRVEGLRVTGNKGSETYQVVASDTGDRRGDAKPWRETLEQMPRRAMHLLGHLRGKEPAHTIDALYKVADAGLGTMRLQDLELTLHYLAALGVVRLGNDLIPTAVRVEIRQAFEESFDTHEDQLVREELHERNRLRVWRLDALQVLTRIEKDREGFARDFFDAPSVSDARQVVLDRALEVDEGLLRQFGAVALEDYFKQLTLEQQEVVRASQTENVIVQAGPGTGKTHTLINCVAQRLIASEKIEGGRNPNGPVAASSILVLAYTRAVVEELRDRLRRLLTLLGRNETPQVHTFHSYALMRLGDQGRRSVQMEDAITDFNTAFGKTGLPSPPTHVFVDEFQDITSERDEMLRAILKRSPTTLITAIGDPDQSIYDYDKGSGAYLPAEDYFRASAGHFKARAIHLSVNFRSDRAVLDVAKAIFPRDLLPGPSAGEGTVERETPGPGQPAQAVLQALKSHRQVAVLFRSNAELYEALPTLRAATGVNLRVLGGRGRIVLSREINEALAVLERDHSGKACSESLVSSVLQDHWENVWERRFARHLLDGAALFIQGRQSRTVRDFVAWVREDPAGNHLLYATQLRRREVEKQELILSTMHRTKGLEFDAVVMTPSDIALKGEDLPEEERLRYVAVTRARHRLVLLDGPREKALEAASSWPGGGGQLGRRFDTVDAEGKGAFKLFDFSYCQDYILQSVRESDPLELRGNAVWHNGTCLCSVANHRRDLQGQTLQGIFVTEVVRLDGFGDEDQYKDRYEQTVQKQGWCYVVNAAGYLRR